MRPVQAFSRAAISSASCLLILLAPLPAFAQSCPLPWGGSIDDGQSVTAYSIDHATIGGMTMCASNSETRNCNSGVLSGSYTYESCNEACVLGGNNAILHGQTVTAYQDEFPWGGCVSESRTCNNGTLDGAYAYSSCSARCNWSGSWYMEGQSLAAYSSTGQPSTSFPAGLCADIMETRTCQHDGTFTGSYPNSQCTDGCQAPWGTWYHSNDGVNHPNIIAYENSSGNCDNFEEKYCQDSAWFNGSNYNPFTYTNQSCTPGGGGSSPCNLPWGGTINDGDSVTAYLESSPAGSCTSETRNCSNGTLSGSYTNQSCTPGGGGGAGPADCP